MRFIYNAPAILHKGALIIGDTHFGMEEKLRSKGIYDNLFSLRLFEQLKKLIREHKAKKIIFVGDVKENITVLDYRTEQVLSKLAELVEIIVVRGNHDGGIERFRNAKIIPSEGFIYEGLAIFHGHTWPGEELMKCRYIISGHQHPRVAMKDRLGKIHIETAWIVAPADKKRMEEHYEKFNPKIKLILLPAFNPLVGRVIDLSSEEHLGPLLNKKIFKLHTALVFRLDGTNVGMLKYLKA